MKSETYHTSTLYIFYQVLFNYFPYDLGNINFIVVTIKVNNYNARLFKISAFRASYYGKVDLTAVNCNIT